MNEQLAGILKDIVSVMEAMDGRISRIEDRMYGHGDKSQWRELFEIRDKIDEAVKALNG